MTKNKKAIKGIKKGLHPRNKHQGSYDFTRLQKLNPNLKRFIHINAYQNMSIDFFNPLAVTALNKSLLMAHYNLDFWEIPSDYLCPAVPGRADYIHYLADLLQESRHNNKTKGIPKAHGLDIGSGANCVYPIIGTQEYNWTFVATDIDPIAIKAAEKIVSTNPTLVGRIEHRHQADPTSVFSGIIDERDYFDFTMCNPPFHKSAKEAQESASRKLKNLGQQSGENMVLNFGGQSNELWCHGGELTFISQMVDESVQFSNSCYWFTTLVSKQENLEIILAELEKRKATKIKTIAMSHGHKKSRIVAWTFLTVKQQKIWSESRWI